MMLVVVDLIDTKKQDLSVLVTEDNGLSNPQQLAVGNLSTILICHVRTLEHQNLVSLWTSTYAWDVKQAHG